MTRPDILVIGAMKAATSTVCGYLEHHPEVYMPRGEPNFFNHHDNWAKGPDWYAAWFRPRTTERLLAEGSNGYTAGWTYPETAARIREFCPDVKLVYMVRHPMERIVSAWIQYRQDKGEFVGPDLDASVRARRDIFVEQSAYWSQLQRYREHFPDAQIFVGFMEDLMADEAAELRRLCTFLGIDAGVPPQVAQANPSKGKPLPTATLSRIRRIPGIRQLKRLIPDGPRRRFVRRTLYTPLDARPALSPELRAELANELRDDAVSILEYAGKPPGFWKLD